jgi:hypothetical protein
MAHCTRFIMWLLAASILFLRPAPAAGDPSPSKPPDKTTQLPNDPSRLSAAQRAKLAEAEGAARRLVSTPRYTAPTKSAVPAETVIPPERAGLDPAVLAARFRAKREATLAQVRSGMRPAGAPLPVRDKRAFMCQPTPPPATLSSNALTPAERAKAAQALKRAPAARKEGAR